MRPEVHRGSDAPAVILNAFTFLQSKFEPGLDCSERELAEWYRYKQRIASIAIHGKFLLLLEILF